MEKRQVNPWGWQDEIGFSQARRLDDVRGLIVVSGQTGVDEGGNPPHRGDFSSEVRLLFRNMERVLEQSGASLDDVFKLTVFLLDMGHNREFNEIKKELFAHAPAQTTIGVTELADPGISLEVEALAVA